MRSTFQGRSSRTLELSLHRGSSQSIRHLSQPFLHTQYSIWLYWSLSEDILHHSHNTCFLRSLKTILAVDYYSLFKHYGKIVKKICCAQQRDACKHNLLSDEQDR